MHRELARAKLNLMLRVLAREASGFHQIETVFCSLELADEIEVSLGGDVVSIDVVAPDDAAGPPPCIGDDADNLAYLAAHRFNEAVGLDGDGAGAHIRLIKRIPAGAGLGGGSSDAAAVLRALNRLHGSPLPADALLAVGAMIGSDVPFFLSGATLALGWGRGGRLLPLPALPAAHVLLAVPAEGVPTGDAYGALAHLRRELAAELEAGSSPHAVAPAVLRAPASWRDAAALAHNDFEPIVFQRLPRLGTMRDALAGLGACMTRLTGTGSVVFGVFEDAGAAAIAAREMAGAFPDARFVLTRTVGTDRET